MLIQKDDHRFPTEFFLLLTQNSAAADFFYSLPDFKKNDIFHTIQKNPSRSTAIQAVESLSSKDLSFFERS